MYRLHTLMFGTADCTIVLVFLRVGLKKGSYVECKSRVALYQHLVRVCVCVNVLRFFSFSVLFVVCFRLFVLVCCANAVVQ